MSKKLVAVRVSREVWEGVQAQAKAEGRSITSIVEASLCDRRRRRAPDAPPRVERVPDGHAWQVVRREGEREVILNWPRSRNSPNEDY